MAAVPSLDQFTFRQLRRDKSFFPFAEVVHLHLPMVYGTALALIPESPASAEEVTIAAFQTLTIRWKKPSRRTVVAAWLLRTTRYACARERARLKLKLTPESSAGALSHGLIKRVTRLKPSQGGPLVLSAFFGQSSDEIAANLRSTPTRVEKRILQAKGKLGKGLRKLADETGHENFDALALLKNFSAAPSQEVNNRILVKVADWGPGATRGDLVRASISSWRWRNFFIFVRRAAAVFGCFVALLISLAATFFYLANQGYLNLIFMEFGQRKDIKLFPAMAQPARPWNGTLAGTPRSAAELYVYSNIWPAKISMTKAQWKAIQPRRVKPIPRLVENDRVKLRNPHASRSGLAGAIGLDFPWSEGSFEFAGQKFENVGLRFRGNGSHVSSLLLNKQSYKVDLNRVKKGQDLVGLNSLNFVNALSDYSSISDALAQKLFREIGAVAPRTAYAYLTVDAPGRFTNQALGLYVLIENIDADFAKDRFGSKSVPIFKPVTYELFADWGRDWSAYKDVYDLKTKATEEQLIRVMDLAKLTTHSNDEEFARMIPEFLDLEEYAAFMAGHVLLSSYDGYFSDGQNFYIYLDPRSNKFGFISWDQDLAWGAMSIVGTAEKREHASIWNPETYDHRFLKRVMKVEAFRKIYRSKLEEALSGPFTVERLYREIDELAAVVRPALAAEGDFRVERFETAISTNFWQGPRNGKMEDGTAFGPLAPPQQIKRFIEARTKSIRDQLDGKTEGARIYGFGRIE